MYGLRLLTSVRELEPSELLDLITWLPSGSAVHALQEKDGNVAEALEVYGWVTPDEVQLQILNSVRDLIHATVQVNSTKRIPAPEAVKGPRSQVKTRDDANGIAKGLLEEAKKRGA